MSVSRPIHDDQYADQCDCAADEVEFIVSARSLGFSLTDIGEFLSARDEGTLPCKRVLDSIDGRISDIDRRIADLLALRDNLSRVRADGEGLPPDKKCDDDCLCYIITTDLQSGQVTIQREEKT